MNHVSFGSTLREARIAKGYDLATVARRLRIRPDILQAIEASDFSRMPPRGYARNMIRAYADLLGLNANDVTRMYLDDAYANQIGEAHAQATQNRYNQRNTSGAVSRPSTRAQAYQETPYNGRVERRGATDGSEVNHLGRRTFSLEVEDKISGGRNRTYGASVDRGEGYARPHRSRRTALNDNYTNAVAGRFSGFDLRGILPYALGGIIIVLLLFVILNLTVCHKEEPVETIPVTDTEAVEEDDEEEEVVEVAPTEFTLSYTVDKGKSTYIEVYEITKNDDGEETKTTLFAGDVDGKASKSFTSSGDIKFVCTEKSGVTVEVDGEKQTLEDNEDGIVNVTYSFSDILEQWNKDHPNANKKSSSKSSSSSSSSSKSSSSSSSDDEDDSDSSSSSSADTESDSSSSDES